MDQLVYFSIPVSADKDADQHDLNMFPHIIITWPALWNAPVLIYYHNCWHECNFDHFCSKHGANWKGDLKRSLSSLSSVSPQLLSPPSAVPCPVCCGVKCKADWAQMPPVRQTQQSNSGCVWGAKANSSTRTESFRAAVAETSRLC